MVAPARLAAAAAAARPDPGGVSWRIHREVALLLGWGAAILLQVAHPLVARAVADHSDFRRDWRAPWRRLHRTVGAMLALTFGTADDVAAAARRITGVHGRVDGTLPAPEGPFPAGTVYSARDPALLTWVHATCLDAFARTYALYVGPLSAADHDRYCLEASGAEELLGAPAGSFPRSGVELERYLAAMLASGEVTVTDTARALAADLLRPPLVAPLAPLLRLSTIGLLPHPIREQYGFPWDARRQTALRVGGRVVRGALRLTPPVLRHWPHARAAFRRESTGPRPERAR